MTNSNDTNARFWKFETRSAAQIWVNMCPLKVCSIFVFLWRPLDFEFMWGTNYHPSCPRCKRRLYINQSLWSIASTHILLPRELLCQDGKAIVISCCCKILLLRMSEKLSFWSWLISIILLSVCRSLPLYTTTERREDTLVPVTDVLANTERIQEVEVMLVASITTEFYSISTTLVISERWTIIASQLRQMKSDW